MTEITATHEIIDNEHSKIIVYKISEKYWTESEIFIISPKNQPYDFKTIAKCGPYVTVQEALDSIPGKITVKEISEQESPAKEIPGNDG